MMFVAGLLIGFGLGYLVRRHAWLRRGYANGLKDRDVVWRDAMRRAAEGEK